MLPTITPDILDLPAGTRVEFPATFAEYEALLDRLGDRAAVRMRFRDNQILLMAPLPEHGNQADILSDLVKAMLRKTEQDWQGYGVMTLRKRGVPGVEPDACFYIQNWRAVLGKRRLDLDVDPPPDLALETDLTSFTRIEDYVPFEIPEVWIYKAGRLEIYRFVSGRYLEQKNSSIFPEIPVQVLLPVYVKRAWQTGSSHTLREFERVLEA
ncbi:Uma2 family endonuclease [Nodosilinea sp. LEGE 07298]|uniref:Uma2 family endonuclease n=1 Tax=Nodosilinea sp. LEGE 07298 TaxID=2777970 RepID=UPI00187E1484|nr:Uma2 family endonuclease [Nodosilinea sp. LEGE 07298]MBE9112740.1 Uma2 family endonuclease [Nodosilinea sp. LEGE 07298]